MFQSGGLRAAVCGAVEDHGVRIRKEEAGGRGSRGRERVSQE